MSANKKGFVVEDAKRAVDAIGIDMKKEKWSLANLATGMNVEREHGNIDKDTDVVPDKKSGADDPIYFAKIAIAHLRERTDYYKRLRKVEESKKSDKYSDEHFVRMKLKTRQIKNLRNR